MDTGAEVETQALVAVLVRQGVLRVEVARVDQVNGGLVVERCKVLSAVMVVFHDLLALPDHVFFACFFLLLAAVLLPFLGVCWKSNRCLCSGGVLTDRL